MAGYYTVKQGDHLSGIALQYGFSQYSKVWNHPNNADLKASRKSPHILFPGDQVYVPDSEARDEQCGTENLHKFHLKAEPLKLLLKLERAYQQPIANTPCELSVDSKHIDLTSDGDGVISQEIAATAVKATLVVKDSVEAKGQEVPLTREFAVLIGHLDPVTEVSGQLARLANLGYYRDTQETVNEEEFLSAVEEFQCDQKLTVDGICGPQTQGKLEEAHGC